MKVLITGGAGYVGGALTDMLKDSEHEFMVYDNLLFEDDYLKDVPFTYGDVRDYDELLPWLEWADCVVWLAGIVGDGACQVNPEITTAVNRDAVEFLADNFKGRIVFPSTCSVYGAQDGLLTEGSPTNPLSLYASSKLDCEKILKDSNAMIFRLGTLFGLGDRYSRIRLDLVVNTLTAKACTEGKLKVFGGEQWRPLLHVRDAAQAMLIAIDSPTVGVFNLSHTNAKIADLAAEVQQLIPCEIETEEMKFEDARNYQVVSGITTSLAPREGILELRDLLHSGRIKDINNPRYNNYGYLSR